MNALERIGGEAALSAIVHDFIGRCYDDVMIGFLFRRAERSRIERHEIELIANHLGAPVQYTGRPLSEAHRVHRILGGQFDRRRRLFEQTLEAHGVDESLRFELLAWQDSMRPLVAGPPTSSGCLPPETED